MNKESNNLTPEELDNEAKQRTAEPPLRKAYNAAKSVVAPVGGAVLAGAAALGNMKVVPLKKVG